MCPGHKRRSLQLIGPIGTMALGSSNNIFILTGMRMFCGNLINRYRRSRVERKAKKKERLEVKKTSEVIETFEFAPVLWFYFCCRRTTLAFATDLGLFFVSALAL